MGVPLDVLADVAQISKDELSLRISQAVAQGILQRDGDLVSASAGRESVAPPPAEALGRAFDSLLRYYGDSGEAERCFRQEAERYSGINPNTIGA